MPQGPSLIQATPTLSLAGSEGSSSLSTGKTGEFLHMRPSQLLDQLLPWSLKENPFFLPTILGKEQTEKGTPIAFVKPQDNILTCYSLCIYNVCCCFCHSSIQNIIAHCIQSPRVQSSLLLAGTKGLNAQIHLCNREAN